MGDRLLTVAVFHEPTGWTIPDLLYERIESACDGRIDIARAENRAKLLEQLPATECLVGFPFAEMPREPYRPELLKWVQLVGAAGDASNTLRDAMSQGVRVTTAASIRSPMIAEHAMTLLLALIRRLPHAMTMQAEHRWGADELAVRMGSLLGRNVAVLADGSTGQAIAQRLKAFGANVLATRKDTDKSYLHVDDIYSIDDADEMLSRADAVIVALPRLPGTVGLLDRRKLSRLSRHAVIVDVSRGGIIDEEELLIALRRGRLAGAALDGFETEVLPPGSPLWTMPNVLVTPRIAPAGPAYWHRAIELAASNIDRYLANRPLVDEINPMWIEDGPLG